MLRFTYSIQTATSRRRCKGTLWEYGQWFLGKILSSAVDAIEMFEYGICLLGAYFSKLWIRCTDLFCSESLHTLRGHTSTVRCLKMPDENTAISGSRDTTLRVWDIKTGLCKNVLVGHQASVRCLEIKGDIVVSGSYDTTARVWSISEGRCLRTLSGHFSQIYAIAFDGTRIATGSLDTSVRIWDPNTG
jgi:WD40 repeat protein